MRPLGVLMLCLLAADASPPSRPVALRGVIRVVDPPRPRKLRMNAEPAAAALHPQPAWSEDIQVGPENRVQGAFVCVKKGLEGRRFPVPPAATLRHEKAFLRPRIQALRAGQDLKVRSEDDFLHNTHALPFVNPEFNIGHPNRSEDQVKRFDRPEDMFRVRCDIHPWEDAWIAVVDHPFFAVTGPDGAFEIRDLPPGRYTVEIWQERYLPVTRIVIVGGRTPVTLDVTLLAKK